MVRIPSSTIKMFFCVNKHFLFSDTQYNEGDQTNIKSKTIKGEMKKYKYHPYKHKI